MSIVSIRRAGRIIPGDGQTSARLWRASHKLRYFPGFFASAVFAQNDRTDIKLVILSAAKNPGSGSAPKAQPRGDAAYSETTFSSTTVLAVATATDP
jgi:hypothetical protein